MEACEHKACGRCKAVLPFDEFNRSRHTPSGLRSQCKNCMALERAATADRRREYRNRPEVREWYRGYRRSRQGVEKVKRDARNASRVLSRQPCEVCGAARAQAHHDDYSKPLDVRWLCVTHHAEWHRNNTPKCPDQKEEIAA